MKDYLRGISLDTKIDQKGNLRGSCVRCCSTGSTNLCLSLTKSAGAQKYKKYKHIKKPSL